MTWKALPKLDNFLGNEDAISLLEIRGQNIQFIRHWMQKAPTQAGNRVNQFKFVKSKCKLQKLQFGSYIWGRKSEV